MFSSWCCWALLLGVLVMVGSIESIGPKEKMWKRAEAMQKKLQSAVETKDVEKLKMALDDGIWLYTNMTKKTAALVGFNWGPEGLSILGGTTALTQGMSGIRILPVRADLRTIQVLDKHVPRGRLAHIVNVGKEFSALPDCDDLPMALPMSGYRFICKVASSANKPDPKCDPLVARGVVLDWKEAVNDGVLGIVPREYQCGAKLPTLTLKPLVIPTRKKAAVMVQIEGPVEEEGGEEDSESDFGHWGDL